MFVVWGLFCMHRPKYIEVFSDIYIKDYVESLWYDAEFYYHMYVNTGGDALS